MPRKVKAEQEGRFAKGRKNRHRWPQPSVWGHGAGAGRALDRWFARRDCDGTCDGVCDGYQRLSRLRTMYGRRSRSSR